MMKLTQVQCEAFADVIVLAMSIDGHFSLVEDEEISKIIESIGWDENLSPGIHIHNSIAKARDLVGFPDKVQAYLQKLEPALCDPQVARFVFEETTKVLNSDGGNADEGAFIKQLRSTLGV